MRIARHPTCAGPQESVAVEVGRTLLTAVSGSIVQTLQALSRPRIAVTRRSRVGVAVTVTDLALAAPVLRVAVVVVVTDVTADTWKGKRRTRL